MKTISDLLKILQLEPVSVNTYIGESVTVGTASVFGGQVLAQAISAAYNTITNKRILHSLHAYFLEAGNLNLPITYAVEIIRDGGSFSTRRVTANQGKKIIFILAASFHKIEEGYEHQMPMKLGIKPPEELLSWTDMLAQFSDFLPPDMKSFLRLPRPITFKPTNIVNPMDRKNLEPTSDVWFKFNLDSDQTPISITQKQQMLTYASDYNILTTALNPHASIANFKNTQMASLDHAMWFFNDFDINDWLLFSVASPNASGARGFTRGHIYTREGKLIASVAQEGLMRPIKKRDK